MARLPRTEAEIVTSAEAMISVCSGIGDQVKVDYPSPPVATASRSIQ